MALLADDEQMRFLSILELVLYARRQVAAARQSSLAYNAADRRPVSGNQIFHMPAMSPRQQGLSCL